MGSMGVSSEGAFILCAKCGSKWEARQVGSTSEIVSMKVVTVGTNEEGVSIVDKLSWVDVKRKPEFWRRRSLGLEVGLEVAAARTASVVCPRCGADMRWIRRVNTYFCDNDGYLLGKNDPFVLKGEVIPAHNQGGQYNQ